jgi:heat shock protein HslJ
VRQDHPHRVVPDRPRWRTLRAVTTRLPLRSAVALLALAALPLAGCGDDDDGATAPTIADLDGRTFVSTSVEGQTLVEGSQVSIAFEEGSISVQAGCNTLFGGVELDGSTLVTTGQLATTQMACDDALMAQDDWLAAMLTAGPEVTLEGDTLTLATDDVTITATESS